MENQDTEVQSEKRGGRGRKKKADAANGGVKGESSALTAVAPIEPRVVTPASPSRRQQEEAAVLPREKVEVNLTTLLEAGAQFGHQAARWNPRMLPYIYGTRNTVHIINLDQTLDLWKRAQKFVTDLVSRGGEALFVGTKQQAKDIIRTEALRCGGHFVTERWLGGMLTNFQTIKHSISRMQKLENFLHDAEQPDTKIKLGKFERLNISRELDRLYSNLGGIRMMKKHPDVVFVIDINKEAIAVAESRRLRIPVIALVDTNTDPGSVDFPIPANDDASRAIRLFTAGISDAVTLGKEQYAAYRAAQAEAQERARESKAKGKTREKVVESPAEGDQAEIAEVSPAVTG